MRRVSIALPDALYRELQQAAAMMDEPGYGPVNFATDVLASELASRRLPKVTQGAYGPRIMAERPAEPEAHRISWGDIAEGAANASA